MRGGAFCLQDNQQKEDRLLCCYEVDNSMLYVYFRGVIRQFEEKYQNIDKTSKLAITQLKKDVIRVELLLPVIIAFFAPNNALSMW